tara:strand:- start:3210 stop:6596 length:3387 start_codon:yes stop_codon:yes gene_type:complete
VSTLRSFFALASLLLMPVAYAAEPYPGTVIESVAPYFAAERGGLKAGDRIVGWSSADTPETIKPLTGAFALRLLEREVHQRTPVTLHGWRGDVRISITPAHGRWRIGAHPDWPNEVVADYEQLRARITTDAVTAVDDASKLATSMQAAGDPEAAAWLWYSLSAAAAAEGRWPQATELYRKALGELQSAAFTAERGLLWYLLAGAQVRQNLFDEAVASHEQALALESTISTDRLAIAANYVGLGQIARRRSDLTHALSLLESARSLQERLAPESLLVASTLQELARIHLALGDIELAADQYDRAYTIASVRDPGGVAASGYLNGLGIVNYMRGDVAAAEQQWTLALQMKQRMEPGSRNVASILHNVGLINRERGDLREAESYYREALAIGEHLEPGSLNMSRTLNNLGTLALEQGDLRNAEYFHQRAFEVRQSTVPDSLDLVISLINLGNVAREKEDYQQAVAFYRDALTIQERIAPNTADHARILANLGVSARLQQQLEKAEQLFEQALQVQLAIAPDSADTAEIATQLGQTLLASGEPARAAAMYEKASNILTELAPDTFRSARAWHGLALVAEATGDAKTANQHYVRAVGALQRQQERLGGSDESRARVKARFMNIYKDYIRFLLEAGEPERAFEILEQSRAKELSNMLAERDLVFAESVPPELERERRQLGKRYEDQQRELYSTTDAARREELQTSLLAIRREQDAMQRRLRDEAPGLAQLKYPGSHSFEDYRQAVPAGAVAVIFNLNKTYTDSFLIDRHGQLHVARLEVGEDALREQVRRFRFLIDAGRWDSEPGAPLLDLAARLYEELLEPLQSQIEDADLLLIVPDGALQVLPFAALRRNNGATGQYLAEWKPSLLVSSLGIYSQLAQRSDSQKTGELRGLVAFGDPNFLSATESTAAVNKRVGYNLAQLAPLPWTATEVKNIADTYPENSVIYTGAEATEERAKSVPGSTRFLHFATHAMLDVWHPLDTAIVLSAPDDPENAAENGLLSAWEIYEGLRVDAELVTLSACETALGGAYSGEGLLGLTRAFQYAGASTVMASLWNINDRSTSDLMTHFYKATAEGLPLAEALQQAQLAMLRGDNPAPRSLRARLKRWLRADDSTTSLQHPYHWGGFVMNGRGH